MVERRFVKMSKATIDIGRRVAINERGEPPESNPQTMQALGELDVLSAPVG